MRDTNKVYLMAQNNINMLEAIKYFLGKNVRIAKKSNRQKQQ